MNNIVRYKKPRLNAISLGNLLIGLQDGCHSMIELSEMSGLAIQSVRHYCNTFHRMGICHIADWNEDKRGGRTLKVFMLGSGTDMPKPKPKPKKEHCKQYRLKMKQKKLLHTVASNGANFKEAA